MSLKLACGILLLLVLARIVSVNRSRPQGFDEPAHVAAGMEMLQFHTYHLDPLHPPLARLAASGLLYLSGVRFREENSSSLPKFWDAGNSILYQGSYLRNLSLARFGMLPFFAITVLVVFLWTRREFGSVPALTAIALLFTLPVVLAFSSLAYTDFPAACVQLWCILAFTEWLVKPGLMSSAGLGALFGLAALTKFTSLLYVPIALAAILACRMFLMPGSARVQARDPQVVLRLGLVLLTTVLVIWGGYRFSIGGIDEALGIEKTHMPSFQHFPAPARGLAREIVASDWRIPAPEFFAGMAQVWVLNGRAPDAYLFGRTKPGGWWYFFLVEYLFKTPVPFLLLVVAGARPVYRRFRAREWKSLVPATTALAILIFTMNVHVDYGLRHVLAIFPFLAIIAGCGANELWSISQRLDFGKIALVALMAWQCVAALCPNADWISYFNEFAGRDPSKILVSGCDLDCGQDVLKLSDELRQRHIGHVALALWTSADLQKMHLPAFDVLEPFRPTPGWVAVSVRTMREGDVQHSSYPPTAFSWLNRYTPVANIGNTIRLYYIPGSA